MILLDTHVLIWLTEGSDNLGKQAKTAIDEALHRNELFVSAISFWEAGMLAKDDKVAIQINIETWRNQLLDSGLQEIPVNGEMTVLAASLKDFQGGMTDRLVTATAAQLGMHLCTANELIMAWGLDVPCIDARL